MVVNQCVFADSDISKVNDVPHSTKNCSSYFIRELSLRCLAQLGLYLELRCRTFSRLFLPLHVDRRRRDVRGAPKVDDDVVLWSSITAAETPRRRSAATAAKVANFTNSFVVKNHQKERGNNSEVASRRNNPVYFTLRIMSKIGGDHTMDEIKWIRGWDFVLCLHLLLLHCVPFATRNASCSRISRRPVLLRPAQYPCNCMFALD